MRRNLLDELLVWKDDEKRKPLLLRGARQVGKSYLVNQFGEYFPSFCEINFDFHKNYGKIFTQDLDPERINLELSIISGIRIIPGETLLFFDEIQECPDAIRSLRYFYEKMPELHVIAAGSLVEFALDKIGIPVGRVKPLYLYPVSFKEFLSASGNQMLLEALINHDDSEFLPEIMHQKLMKLLGEYIAVGGMPEALAAWLEKKDIALCKKIHRLLIDTYHQDFNKYANTHNEYLLNILYNAAASLVGKKFVFSNVSSEYRARELRPALTLLEKAGVVHRITHSSSGGVPLATGSKPDFFKVILSDVGLMQASLGYEQELWIVDPMSLSRISGSVIEAFIGQELLANSSPYMKKLLYYWAREKRGSTAEVDYVVERRGDVVPVEVKAGTSKKMKSLSLFLKEKTHAPYGVHFWNGNFEHNGNIKRMPLYAAIKISEAGM